MFMDLESRITIKTSGNWRKDTAVLQVHKETSVLVKYISPIVQTPIAFLEFHVPLISFYGLFLLVPDRTFEANHLPSLETIPTSTSCDSNSSGISVHRKGLDRQGLRNKSAAIITENSLSSSACKHLLVRITGQRYEFSLNPEKSFTNDAAEELVQQAGDASSGFMEKILNNVFLFIQFPH